MLPQVIAAGTAAVGTAGGLLAAQKQFAHEAKQYAQQYGLTGNPDGELDAFRHAYVSGRFIQAGLGDAITNGLGQLNEIAGRNTEEAKNMDLYNNQKGREWGASYSTPADLAQRIYQGLQNHELVVIKPTMSFKVSENQELPTIQQHTATQTSVEHCINHPSFAKINLAEKKMALDYAYAKDVETSQKQTVQTPQQQSSNVAHNDELNERGLNKRLLAEAQAESAARNSQTQGQSV
jgi:hypothetical protein